MEKLYKSLNVQDVNLNGKGYMKVALITDQHFGGKQDSQNFLNYQKKFYENRFFPYLLNADIKYVVDLGDTFDRRKFVNFNTLNEVKKFYFDKLLEMGITLYSIVGNHSTYYRNTNSVNSSDLLYGHYPNIKTFSKAESVLVGGEDGIEIDMVPWINSENYDETMDFIKKSKNQIALGHLEVAGFAMYKGYNAEEGISPELFKGYEVVCSGHYHHKSSKGNVHYLGAPYEITWNDYDDPRGFHVLDTKTRQLEFIKNKFRLFEKFYYDDTTKPIDWERFDPQYYAGKIVKLIVEKKENVFDFDKLIDTLYANDVSDLTILEDLSEYSARYTEDGDADVEVGNTADFLDEYVDGLPDNLKEEKSKIKKLLKVIYNEALNMDE